ncbi:hypothetical protein GRI38_05085 [Altererythrobacter aurantiacus]|uniref:Uncharacterized protein n=1 Tax=Parapontixanthobacter aurantiacus TaxID=1463599 RepID=A0A844ZC83_9SPHN|nr:hypothetical protein [Parapontixanthobacter aurantiacus]MXO85398.1 hypothetical protein [Parapontixanthobacter aurantiacus]
MTNTQMLVMATGLVALLAGAYIVFVAGNVLGVVFMGLATMMFGLSASVGAKEKKKDASDAG